MLPDTVSEWDGGAGTSDWAAGANWSGNAVPAAEANVLFGNVPSGQHWDAKSVTNAESDRKLRSLWFASGFDYTLSGAALWLGNTLGEGGRLITVLNPAHRHSEVTFETPINVSTTNPSHHFLIYNESLGGLRFNGAFNTGGHSLWIEGPAGIQFSGAISGVSGGGLAGEIRVKTGAGGYVVFAANNSAWGGAVHVDSGMAVVTADGALGSAALTTSVADGATLALRQRNWGSGGGTYVNYTSAKSLELAGEGIWRFGEGYVGALYNDGGNNTFAGSITLLGTNVAIGSRADRLDLTGAITGNASLTKVGRGIVRLANAGNAYTGATIIKEGALWIDSAAALPGGFDHTNTGTNIELAGGVLMLPPNPSWDGNLTRQLGTGPGQIQWTGSGGFAATGSYTQIRLTNEAGVVTGKLTWGQAGFVPLGSALLFGSEFTSGIVTLRNSIDFAGGQREIYVHRNTIGDIIEGNDGMGFSNGGVIKTGQGRLMLRGAHHYTGPTVILEGLFTELTRDLYGPVQTNYQLGGGTLELNSPWVNGQKTYLYSPMLGAGADQVQWLAGSDGGFAIMESVSGTLRINGSQNEITWGQQYFVGLGNTLTLGHRASSAGHTWDTALNLAGGERTIHIVDSLVGSNPWLGAEFRFTRALRNGSLRLEGDGRLDLAVANDGLEGSVTVSGAELRLNEEGTLSAITALRAERGGRITLDNAGTYKATTGGTALEDRVKNTATVTLDASTLRFWGGEASGSMSSQTLGAVTLAGGASTIDVANHAGAAGSATLHLASLSRSDLTATLNFTHSGGTGAYSDTATGPRIRFATAPSLSGGILPYATVHGSDWATVTDGRYLVAYTGYENGAATAWLAAHNVSIGQNRFASGSLTINSLRFVSNWNLSLQNASTVLNLVSGGLIGASNSRLEFGRLTTAADNLYIHIPNGQFGLSTEVFGNAGLIKSGRGVLRLYGSEANTYTGTTYVHEGILALAKLIGADAVVGDLVVGDFQSTTTVMLVNSHQIADTATVTLRGVQHRHPTSQANIREGVLQFNNGGISPGIREAFDRLHIDGRGVLNFNGGEIARANYLILNRLTFADAASRLIIRRWVEFEDYLLVRRSGNEGLIPPILSQIIFDGYGPARWVPYDNDYWQITPFPEPSIYGAILGAVGIGLVVWKKRRWALRVSEAR